MMSCSKVLVDVDLGPVQGSGVEVTVWNWVLLTDIWSLSVLQLLSLFFFRKVVSSPKLP